MLILWKENIAFLAVPKTGTTAIETALAPFASVIFQRPPSAKHITHQRFNRFIRPYLNKEGKEGIETLALMREPVSWLGSWYRYRQRPELAGSQNSTRNLSFDDFVTSYLLTENRPAFANLGTQARQLSKSKTALGIDHLFRYENIEKFLDFIEDRVGVRLELSQYNVSEKMDLQLSTSVAAHLRRVHAYDFDVYESIGT